MEKVNIDSSDGETMIENDNSIYDSERYKCKIKAIIQNKGLCSIMNNTKWRELKKGIAELPFLPPFVIKSVDFFCYVRRS